MNSFSLSLPGPRPGPANEILFEQADVILYNPFPGLKNMPLAILFEEEG